MKKFILFLTLVALVALPLHPVYAQVALDVQLMEAAEDLSPDVQLEFLELIRDPGEWADAFEEAGITPDIADRIEDRLDDAVSSLDDGYKLDRALHKLEEIDEKVERKLAEVNIKRERFDPEEMQEAIDEAAAEAAEAAAEAAAEVTEVAEEMEEEAEEEGEEEEEEE